MSLVLFAFSLLGQAPMPDGPADQPAKSELSPASSLHYAEVTAVATPTSARGLQIVTVRLKIQPNRVVFAPAEVRPAESAPGHFKLEVSTRDPRTKVHIIYPRCIESTVGDNSFFYYENEVAIQAIIERADKDESPLEGRLTFLVCGTSY